MTKRTGWEAPVTAAELVHGPLAGARLYGTGSEPIRHVRIADDLKVFAAILPHTAVVLTGAAASGGWAVEVAVRRSWEHAAACVVVPAAAISAGSGEVLAERLGVTLIIADEDPLKVAVRVASAVAGPEAARTQLVARCAGRLSEVRPSAKHVVGVLNAELPGTSVAFVDGMGTRLAGRQGTAPVIAEVDVPDLGTIIARGSSKSDGWPSVVRAVLALAVAPLTAWVATEKLEALHDLAPRTALLRRVVEGDLDDTAATVAALGWPTKGPLTAFVIATTNDSLVAATVGGKIGPVVPWGPGWAGWTTLPAGELRLALLDCLAVLPGGAGIGPEVKELARLKDSLTEAEAAAAVAGTGQVIQSDQIGPTELLGALPTDALAGPARAALARLLVIDQDGVLLETLKAVLDEGGASKAAAKLGVHRNTITGRLDRIKAAGFDVDDPGTRLALHLATHILNDPTG